MCASDGMRVSLCGGVFVLSAVVVGGVKVCAGLYKMEATNAFYQGQGRGGFFRRSCYGALCAHPVGDILRNGRTVLHLEIVLKLKNFKVLFVFKYIHMRSFPALCKNPAMPRDK